MPSVKKDVPQPKKSAASGSVISRIRPLSIEDRFIRMSLYGKSGTGKTTFWGTFPGKILAIVCSGGGGELRSLNTPEMRKKIDEVHLTDSREVQEILDYVKNSGKYTTVVLDHASFLQDLLLKEILGLAEIPVQYSWGLATQQQWGQVSVKIKEILFGLLNLPAHTIVVAQERNFEEESSSELVIPYVASALSPSTCGWLNASCDYVCQTFKRARVEQQTVMVANKKVVQNVKTRHAEFCLRVAPDPVYLTKFRIPKGYVLPDVIVDPSYEKVIGLLQL